MIKWTSISLLLHLCAAGLLIAAGPQLQQPKPVMIDLTLAPSLQPAGIPAAPAAGAKLPQPVQLPKKAEAVQPAQQKPVSLPTTQQSKAASMERTAVSQSPVLPVQSQAPTTAGGASSTIRQSGSHTVATPVSGSTVEKSSGSETTVAAGQPQQRYRAQHFGYIRDLIMNHLVYPQLARRRGWSGRVVLSFVVAEDGTVRSIQVKESSGHTLLDSSAMETVKSAAPFPKPPVAAEITMPVVFRLH